MTNAYRRRREMLNAPRPCQSSIPLPGHHQQGEFVAMRSLERPRRAIGARVKNTQRERTHAHM